MQISLLETLRQADTYSLLFPDRESGLVITWLYDKIKQGIFPEGIFRETDIHNAFRELFPGERYPVEYRTNRISQLTEYFLRYDSQRRIYTLKGYAIEFCERAHAVLQKNLALTDVEKLCQSLRENLEACPDDTTLKDWLNIRFPNDKSQLTAQLDYLERQIVQVVNDLRQQIVRRDIAMQQVLEQVIEQLNLLKRQSRELSKAFTEVERMQVLLNEHINRTTDNQFRTSIFDALQIFDNLQRDLGVIDSRIDHVHPRVRQLFHLFTKQLFASKIEFFLHHLLQNSRRVSDNSGRSILALPADVPQFLLHNEVQDFTIVEQRNPFPAKPIPLLVVPEDPERRRLAFAPLQARLDQQQIVMDWFKEFEQLTSEQFVTPFAPFFFRVLQSEANGFTIAVRVAHQVLRHFSRLTDYRLQIDSTPYQNSQNLQITICQMTIYKN
jgi:hypothetical protein